MKRPLTWPLLSLSGGIVCAAYLQIPDEVPLFVMAVALILLLPTIRQERHLGALFLINVIFFWTGALDMNTYLHKEPPPDHISRHLTGDRMTVEGLIDETPLYGNQRVELRVAVFRVLEGERSLPVRGEVLVSAPRSVSVRYGDVVRLQSRLRKPRNFQNPGGFDYVSFLRYRGILARGSIEREADLVVIRSGAGHPLRQALEEYRRKIKGLIRHVLPSPAAEILQASLLGDAREIPREIMDRFNTTGTSHIIAISGFNIGMVALFSVLVVRLVLRLFPRLLLRYDGRKAALVLAVIPVIIYTAVAGAGVSVVRAAIMMVLFIMAVTAGKMRDLYNTLAGAALAILLVSPHALWDLSFQLSFAAVWSILFFTPRLLKILPSVPASCLTPFWARLAGMFREFVAVTLAAAVGTMPIIVFSFNRIAVVTLFSNLLVVPLLGILAIPLGMGVLFTAPLSETIASLFLLPAGWLVERSVELVTFFSSLPYGSLWVSTPRLWEVAVLYLFLYAAAMVMDAKGKRASFNFYIHVGLAVLTFCTLAVHSLYIRFSDPGAVTVTAVDVGQGTAVLVRGPTGEALLVDGGGFYDDRFDVGRYVLSPYLRHERVRSLGAVALSHPHPDHVGGLPYIIENFEVREVWTNGAVSDAEAFVRFLDATTRKALVPRRLNTDTPPFSFDGMAVRVLNPPPRDMEDDNDKSLVLHLSWRGKGILIPGDISRGVEEQICLQNPALRADVLVVSHHGSRYATSERLLDQVKPAVALISAGKENLFGLPHRETLERLSKRGVKIYRTDRDGAITVSLGRERPVVSTFRP